MHTQSSKQISCDNISFVLEHPVFKICRPSSNYATAGCAKEGFYIISLEPISETAYEARIKSVIIDIIGTFWWATTRELYHIT